MPFAYFRNVKKPKIFKIPYSARCDSWTDPWRSRPLLDHSCGFLKEVFCCTPKSFFLRIFKSFVFVVEVELISKFLESKVIFKPLWKGGYSSDGAAGRNLASYLQQASGPAGSRPVSASVEKIQVTWIKYLVDQCLTELLVYKRGFNKSDLYPML